MSGRLSSHRAKVLTGIGVAAVLLVVAGVWMLRWRRTAPASPTSEVTRGEFVDTVEIRGEIRPRKSVLINAPMQAGELQILTLAANGSSVKTGDTVVQFDGSTLQRTIDEKQSELRQAREELEQAKAQAKITNVRDVTQLLHSQYDVDRAKVNDSSGLEGVVSKIDADKVRLALADAEQRLKESEVKEGANRAAATGGFTVQQRKIAKVTADLERAQQALAALHVIAPADGVVSILPNFRASSPMGAPQEFRQGDRAWPGASVLELPDLSSVHLTARLDESDRGRLQLAQHATVRVDAIADHDYQADVTDLSVLARVDFSSWPPVKNFDLKLTFADADKRLRPGMSAMARIVVGRMPDMLLVPRQAVFFVDGRAIVYRLDGRAFVPTPVEVIKRNRDQAAIKGAVRPGDRVSLTKPDADAQKGAV